MSEFYLVIPRAQLKNVTRADDRQYLARPIPVEPLYSSVNSRLLYVRDTLRGCSFPCEPNLIKRFWRLSRKQQRAAAAQQCEFAAIVAAGHAPSGTVLNPV